MLKHIIKDFRRKRHPMCNRLLTIVAPHRTLVVFASLWIAASAVIGQGKPVDTGVLRQWIEEMKRSDRGPFVRIRWFCKDGTVLPPRSSACRNHGGGVQHGEWNDRVKTLRAGGYLVANVLADLDAAAFTSRPDYADALNQIAIEQFLIATDDGWIYRRARYYRGALQEEDERIGARRLLLKLAEDPSWLGRRYLAYRSVSQLLNHGEETKSVAEVRQLSASLADQDANFKQLRNKIHVRPDHRDAAAVREYAARRPGSPLYPQYLHLAAAIDAVYAGGSAVQWLTRLARDSGLAGATRGRFARAATALGPAATAEQRLQRTSELLSEVRDAAASAATAPLRLALVDASGALENEHYTAATVLRDRIGQSTRIDRLRWLRSSIQAVYGIGLISARQRRSLNSELDGLEEKTVIDLHTYKTALDYLALVPGWGVQWQRFHFQNAVHKLAAIEPKAGIFLQDQLRGSPLFFYSQTLDSLLQDANRLAGIRHELFGDEVGIGLRSLNPGLARGRLYLAAGAAPEARDPNGIYLLPETISELPPVAGILTAGEGNSLSHVQLLARNLGIPNVAVDLSLLPVLRRFEGHAVTLAVSVRGSVRLRRDDGAPEDPGQGPEIAIRPDLDKLDLGDRRMLPLQQLRARDSGRTVGPKAAKLGELRHHYPDSVADGLVIPFGVFRDLLRRPYRDHGLSVFDWMVAQYRAIDSFPPESAGRLQAYESFRGRLHQWILDADPGEEFRKRLAAAMADVFGSDGTYGVFVRSDTNVEDLPGFTGAGLNLTVPHVVGIDNVVRAVSQVWASPFTQRAFAWRQPRMEHPEHVYPAVLLLRSVPVDKSGVLVTQDIDTGDPNWLSIAVNEGIGGAVDGQAAESLRVNVHTGAVRLLAQATAVVKNVVGSGDGITKQPVSHQDQVLQPAEIAELIRLVKDLPGRFPPIVDAEGRPAPADIEFGFINGKLALFQIRPYLESKRARTSAYLRSLDRGMLRLDRVAVDLTEAPGGWPG